MFTKLRNKFLILNMSITAMVMIAAFASIYFFTYSSIQSEIQNRLMGSQVQVQTSAEVNELPDDMEKGGTTAVSQSFSLDLFNIEVDGEGRMIRANSYIDMPDEVYQKAAETAWSNKESDSAITLNGKQWRYKVMPISMNIIGKDGQQFTSAESRFSILFLDITEYNKTLYKLLTTLLTVGLITLVVIFIFSLYFAKRAIKPISEAWERQKQFVADASHELKTPLSIINANYDALLANQDETIKSQVKWLDYIKIGTDRMTRLINDLLSMAKMEDMRLEIQKETFDMSNAINDAILSMEAIVAEKGIRLNCSIEPGIIVKSDPERMKQVVTILFDNAAKYTNENGHIDISLTKSKRSAAFSIKNSGKGIARHHLPRIFDRFYRVDPSRTQETGGYGLGLSIAKAIIDRLGGEIYAESKENEYTVFTFTLGL